MRGILLKVLTVTAVLIPFTSAPSHASFALYCSVSCPGGGSCSCWFCGGCTCSGAKPVCGGQQALVANCDQASLAFIKPFEGYDTKDIDFSSVKVEGAAKYGSVEASGDGTFLYTPGSDFTGLDSFSFSVCTYSKECGVEQVLVSVNPKK